MKPSLARDLGIPIVIACVIALLVRGYILEAYRIPTAAMSPTLLPGDTLFVSKLAYRTHPPSRGDVIVFTLPSDPSHDTIKRVVGVGGDTIEVKQGALWVNGQPAVQPSKTADCSSETLPNREPHTVCFESPLPEDVSALKVPSDAVYVLGDLRTQPKDDPLRPINTGPVPLSSIKGKALWIWLSAVPASNRSGFFPQLRLERMFKRVK